MENIDKEVEVEYERLDNGVNINHFFVPKAMRRKGIGTKVLQDLIEKFREDGVDYMVVNMKGGDGAESFLRSNDFDITERQLSHVTAELELNEQN